MKRAHRKLHLVMWLILGPVIITVTLLAVVHRPGDPVNDTIPDVLLEEVR